MMRRLFVQSLWRSRVCDLARYARPARGLILRYHSICADARSRPDYVSSSISVPAGLFDQQVSRLRRKYRCVTLDEVVDHVERRQPLPPRTVALTFDDGYLDNYEYALPVLAKHRVPATVFLVSGTLTSGAPVWTSTLRYGLTRTPLTRVRLPDASGMLTSYTLEDTAQRDRVVRHYTNVLNILSAPRREELLADLLRELEVEDVPKAAAWFLSAAHIQEMRAHGVSFGAHTVSHPNLPGIDGQEARAEIERSKAALEACLGTPMRHFSYPNSGALYPHFDDAVEAYVRRAGFQSAVTSVRGWLSDVTNPFRIHRIGVNRARSQPSDFSIWLERNRLFSPGERLVPIREDA
jgi:peptidoglycan/xylan/chitin deacetylase (PgdA/CDA1 family)